MIQGHMRRNRPRSNLWLYLLLNVLVSAATTLAVLYAWDALRKPDSLVLPPPQQAVAGATVDASKPVSGSPSPTLASPPTPQPTITLPPADQKVIEIVSVVGAGDLAQEVVMLKRLGDGSLRMSGWKIEDGNGNIYTFPTSPELTLFKGGTVLVYTKPGENTATEFYWGRDQPVFSAGETVKVYDTSGLERAAYTLP
jgi:hypothetical protein